MSVLTALVSDKPRPVCTENTSGQLFPQKEKGSYSASAASKNPGESTVGGGNSCDPNMEPQLLEKVPRGAKAAFFVCVCVKQKL
jgi:hypothetical protein